MELLFVHNAPVLMENIPKLLNWFKKQPIILHGGYAIDIQLKESFNKGIYPDKPYTSIDCYTSEKNIDKILGDYQQAFKNGKTIYHTNMRIAYMYYDDTLLAQIQTYANDIFKNIDYLEVNGLKVLPLEKSIAIYWALVNGYKLSLYNARFDRDYNRLLQIGEIMKEKMPSRIKIRAEPSGLPSGKRTIDIDLLTECYYTGYYALALYLREDLPEIVEIACFGETSSIVDIISDKYGHNHAEWNPSTNWGLIPGYYEITGAKPTIKLYDCSTYSTGVFMKIKSVCFIGLAAFHPGEISLKVLATLITKSLMENVSMIRMFMGDTIVGKGIADTVLRDLMAKSSQDRYSYTTNIEFVREALKIVMTSPIQSKGQPRH